MSTLMLQKRLYVKIYGWRFFRSIKRNAILVCAPYEDIEKNSTHADIFTLLRTEKDVAQSYIYSWGTILANKKNNIFKARGELRLATDEDLREMLTMLWGGDTLKLYMWFEEVTMKKVLTPSEHTRLYDLIYQITS